MSKTEVKDLKIGSYDVGKSFFEVEESSDNLLRAKGNGEEIWGSGTLWRYGKLACRQFSTERKVNFDNYDIVENETPEDFNKFIDRVLSNVSSFTDAAVVQPIRRGQLIILDEDTEEALSVNDALSYMQEDPDTRLKMYQRFLDEIASPAARECLDIVHFYSISCLIAIDSAVKTLIHEGEIDAFYITMISDWVIKIETASATAKAISSKAATNQKKSVESKYSKARSFAIKQAVIFYQNHSPTTPYGNAAQDIIENLKEHKAGSIPALTTVKGWIKHCVPPESKETGRRKSIS